MLALQEIVDEVAAESSLVGPILFVLVVIVAIIVAIRKLK